MANSLCFWHICDMLNLSQLVSNILQSGCEARVKTGNKFISHLQFVAPVPTRRIRDRCN
jgi:hypothetical protein